MTNASCTLTRGACHAMGCMAPGLAHLISHRPCSVQEYPKPYIRAWIPHAALVPLGVCSQELLPKTDWALRPGSGNPAACCRQIGDIFLLRNPHMPASPALLRDVRPFQLKTNDWGPRALSERLRRPGPGEVRPHFASRGVVSRHSSSQIPGVWDFCALPWMLRCCGAPVRRAGSRRGDPIGEPQTDSTAADGGPGSIRDVRSGRGVRAGPAERPPALYVI